MPNAKHRRPRGTWDASECALLLIDYQENVLDLVFEQDRRVVELNARTLATAARAFNIPVVLSTVGVEMGVNKPTIASIKAALPDVKDIDRSSMNAWEDRAFVAAVKATGRKRLVMGGVVTAVCLAFPDIDTLADGYEYSFIVGAAIRRDRSRGSSACPTWASSSSPSCSWIISTSTRRTCRRSGFIRTPASRR